MQKITFGKDGLPGYICGDVANPAVIVLQVWLCAQPVLLSYAAGTVPCPHPPRRHCLPALLQEWWGINDVIKAHAEKIASHGYRCLVPDLYKGKVGVDKEEAQHVSEAGAGRGQGSV